MTAIPAAGATRTGRSPRKIGALGLRVERGVSYHGIALNVTVDLADFDLIDPCGMPGRRVDVDRRASVGDRDAPPTTASVERAAVRSSPRAFAARRSTRRSSLEA